MKPKVLSSQIVHKNDWYQIRQDKLTWPNGKAREYNIVELPEACIVLCIEDDQVLVIEQYRHPVDEVVQEIPGGMVSVGEDPLDAAKRELREETGYVANHWKKLGVVWILPGICRIKMHAFLAEEVTLQKTEREDMEKSIKTKWVSCADWRAMIKNGEVMDSEALATWALCQESKKAT